MNDADFDMIFTIMEASFPISEFRTYAGQRALLGHPHYRVIPKMDVRDTIIAFLACWEFSSFRFVSISSELAGTWRRHW